MAEQIELLPHPNPDSVMDAWLAQFPGWQFGPREAKKAVRSRDGYGRLSEVLGAPLRALEFDVLAWMFALWYSQGCKTIGTPRNAIIRFTHYEITRAFTLAKASVDGQDRASKGLGGRNNELIREALEALKAAVVTLTGVDAHTGEAVDQIISRVNIIRSYTVLGQMALDWDDPAAVGGMRDETIEVRFEDWITERLFTGALVFDWMVQRRLGGNGKRLWVYLEAHSYDFSVLPGGFERITLDVNQKLFDELNIRRKRDRDNVSALADAMRMILERDPRYTKADDGAPEACHFDRRSRKLTMVRRRRDGGASLISPPSDLAEIEEHAEAVLAA